MANRKNTAHWPIITVVAGVLLLLVAMPESKKQWLPEIVRNTSFHFGLDLVGGTQLDFRISEQEINDQVLSLAADLKEAEELEKSSEEIALIQQQLNAVEEQKRTVVESIRTVLERRINALGVSEALITPSYFGNEKHLLVECPGVVDTQECINIVGKTITLEFKEELIEPTEEFESDVRQKADYSARRVTESGETLQVVGEDVGDDLGVVYTENAIYFKEQVPDGLNHLWNKKVGDKVYTDEGSITVTQQDENGNNVPNEIPGIFLSQVIKERTSTGRVINEAPTAFTLLSEESEDMTYNSHLDKDATDIDENTVIVMQQLTPGSMMTTSLEDGKAGIVFLRSYVPGIEKMEASHILIAYKGASSADTSITRTKEEAELLAEETKAKIDTGESFESLVAELSDGPSKDKGGSLGSFSRESMVAAFSQASFDLGANEISDVVETAFGFHIIRADVSPYIIPDVFSYDELIIGGENASQLAQETIEKLQNGDVKSYEDIITLKQIFFSLQPTGWKDTSLDGKHFRSATVTLDPTTNIPVVQISFNDEGAKLFQELTANNIEKRIAIFVGGQLVSAPTVQTEIIGGIAIITGMQSFDEAKTLAQNLNTGAIPAPIYLSGQRTVEATLGASALNSALKAALIGIALLMLYMIIMYRLLGLLAAMALSTYAFIFFALLKLPLFLVSSQYIVLTLAGMAGIILGIGMAVDANVLIFERMKEELRENKALSTSAETGFKRAWPSIRDGNVSTLITCAVLFTIGTSIVRGFAITLGIGVLLSMFTAIVITRWMVRKVSETPLAEKRWLFISSRGKSE
ncbi:protein translocase subunit SecD [Candidatus Peregrinibacteria bacterium]|nr:protein translocase subunit SecD [Candidatus Peregrinibacteria bacterium]